MSKSRDFLKEHLNHRHHSFVFFFVFVFATAISMGIFMLPTGSSAQSTVTLTSVSPTSGAEGILITITGSNMNGCLPLTTGGGAGGEACNVMFFNADGVRSTVSGTEISNTQVTVIAAGGHCPGPATIRVGVPTDMSNPIPFTIVAGPNTPASCFPATPTPTPTSAPAVNSSSCVSINVPSSMTIGQVLSGVSVTMQNTGTTTWSSDATPHRLGSEAPRDNNRWGLGRVVLPVASVAPGSQATFAFDITAPITPGTYSFDWSMLEETVEWFGAICQRTVTVVDSTTPTPVPTIGPQAACNSSNLFLTSAADIMWGNITATPSQVSTSPGSVVRLSVSGEDGCAGQTVTFQIIGGSTFQGVLSLGSQLSGGRYQLYYDWTNNLTNGTYRFRTINPIQSSQSANELIVGTAQQCSLSRVYASPNGGIQGATIQLIVEAQGTCQGWQASINVLDTLANNSTIWSGSAQTYAGTNSLVWNFTLPPVPVGRTQNVYIAEAHLDSQALRSSTFIDCRDASACSISGPTPQPSPGQTLPYEWSVTNPFRGGASNPQTLILEITNWILNVATALIVLLIIYAGIRFMLAAGRPAEISRAKNILFWALVGFAVVLIGKGFIALIISVLQGDIPTF